MDKIALIGCGKLGSALLKGFLSGDALINRLVVYDTNPAAIDKELNCEVARDIKEAVDQASVIILCVKPNHAAQVLEQMKPCLQKDQILCSTVMGLSIDDIRSCTNDQVEIVRVMPNIASETRQSVTCITETKKVKELFEALGPVIMINETLMNASTVMSGSGIAFALRFMRAMQQGGIAIGFDAKTSLELSAGVMMAAAGMVMQKQKHPETLIDQVTTPAGCTIKGLQEMELAGLSSAVMSGVIAANEYILIRSHDR